MRVQFREEAARLDAEARARSEEDQLLLERMVELEQSAQKQAAAEARHIAELQQVQADKEAAVARLESEANKLRGEAREREANEQQLLDKVNELEEADSARAIQLQRVQAQKDAETARFEAEAAQASSVCPV